MSGELVTVTGTTVAGDPVYIYPAIQLGCGLARFPHEAQLRLSGVFRQ